MSKQRRTKASKTTRTASSGHTNKSSAKAGATPKRTDEPLRSVQKLIQSDQVLLGSSSTVALPPPGPEMIGRFRLHPRGFGFIVPDSPTEHGDLFVPAGNTDSALTGDHVRARVIHRPRRVGRPTTGKQTISPYIGMIVEIIQRSERQYVGNLMKRGDQWVVRVDGKLLNDPVIIRDPHAKNATAGDKVAIELIEYPSGDQVAEGVITEVLGESGLPDVETLAVMKTYGLADKFPPPVLEEARAVAARFDDNTVPTDREDLTKRLICTIDPPDARDFDDAISIDRLDSKTETDGAAYELGIHIADVSHFIAPGGELDREAYTRGTSTYLPRKVVPMLPELLSNGVCSLQEGVNRFCKSAFIRYDDAGNVLSERFANGVIRSAKRLTYLEAQALIDDDLAEARRHTQGKAKYPRAVIAAVKCMDELAKILRRRRLKDGMIVLGLPEVRLVFDEAGNVVDAEPEDDAFTHTVIEMFMVEANEATARLFDRLDVPLIRRVHPDPSPTDLTDLRQFARVAGYNIPQQPSRKELQTLLDVVRGKPAQHAVHMAVLKTLSKAEYSPQLVGHFALASTHYTHFTSPIRRYPDLLVHRALAAYLEHTAGDGTKLAAALRKKMQDDPRCPDEKTLTEFGRHCSTTERNAESAERDLRTFLVLELLNQHLGDDFNGTVTGVTNSGVFMQIDRYLVDGFIPAAELPSPRTGDRWKLNRTTGAMVAQRSGKTITIGDRFVVRIANVNPPGRTMELVIIESHPSASPKRDRPKRDQPKGARKAHQETMGLKRTAKKKPKHPPQQKKKKKKTRRR